MQPDCGCRNWYRFRSISFGATWPASSLRAGREGKTCGACTPRARSPPGSRSVTRWFFVTSFLFPQGETHMSRQQFAAEPRGWPVTPVGPAPCQPARSEAQLRHTYWIAVPTFGATGITWPRRYINNADLYRDAADRLAGLVAAAHPCGQINRTKIPPFGNRP